MLNVFESHLFDYCAHVSLLQKAPFRPNNRPVLREVFDRMPFVFKVAVIFGVLIFVLGTHTILRKSVRRLTPEEYLRVDAELTSWRPFEKSQAALRVFAVFVLFWGDSK